MTLKAVIFDLDGVLTNTAEYHYRTWQRLCDEEGISFSREKNELLRGTPRHRSLELILGDHKVSPARFEEMLRRKNDYFQVMLPEMTTDDLLPGIADLLDELEKAGILMGVGSASRNARPVLEALGISPRFQVIADAYSVRLSKPAPDVFLFAARQMGVEAHECVVVEDAISGVDAALTGGFGTVGIGPTTRVGHAHVRLDDTKRLTLAQLRLAHERARV